MSDEVGWGFGAKVSGRFGPEGKQVGVTGRVEYDVQNNDLTVKVAFSPPGRGKSVEVVDFSCTYDFDRSPLSNLAYPEVDYSPELKFDAALRSRGKETPVIVGGSIDIVDGIAGARLGFGTTNFNAYAYKEWEFGGSPSSWPQGAILGSRLIDRQSQNRTVAARAMADRKVLAHLS